MPRTADWFNSLTKKAQKEYIAKHPNSKYAKGAKGKAPNPNTDAARIATRANQYSSIASKLIKSAKEKIEAAKTPATKAKWKAEVARLSAIKKDLKEIGAKGKGISVKMKAGTIESVSTLGGSKPSTTRKLSIAAKTKAHDKKRIADKNKVVAKTPSASNKKVKIAELNAQKKEIRETMRGLTRGGTMRRQYEQRIYVIDKKIAALKAK